MKMLKKISAPVIVLLILSGMLLPISTGATENSAPKDMMPVFLSEVIGLDLNKYSITNEEYALTYPSEYGGNVKEENIYLNLDSSEGKISIMGLFLNGFIYGIFVYPPINGSLLFKHQPSTNAVDESRNILQRYKTFAESYDSETSHIDQALTMLSKATGASSASADLNMFNEMTGFVPSVTTVGNVEQEIKEDSIAWIYTDRGVEMINRCLKIDFGSDQLHFVDTWNLYTVGSFSVVSEDEVKQIALEAANNYDLTLVGENGTLYIAEKPEWANVTSIVLNMVPGEIYNDEVNIANPVVSGGNATRDPLALYPLWETVFYFSKNIGGTYGIAVGVWGDTKEIAYITPYGYLGVPGGEDTTTSTEPSPEPAPSENPSQTESGIPFSTIHLIGGIGATAVIAIAVAAVVLKKRRK